MLYGSIKNDFNILGYIPKRIELIFTGIMIFGIVELLLFPSSSRKQVESLSFKFFLDVRDFLKQATICSQRMEQYLRLHTNAANKKILPTLHDERNIACDQTDEAHRAHTSNQVPVPL